MDALAPQTQAPVVGDVLGVLLSAPKATVATVAAGVGAVDQAAGVALLAAITPGDLQLALRPRRVFTPFQY